MIENKIKLKPIKKNGVLVYIGDTNFFKKKISSVLEVPEEVINKNISECTEGVIIEKGSKSFEDFDFNPSIGDKVSFKGYFGQMYSCKVDKDDKSNRAYYRIMEDKDIEAISIN